MKTTSSSVQLLSRVRLFVTPWITACQDSLSITNSRSSHKLTSIESVMPSSHLIHCRPLPLEPTSLLPSHTTPLGWCCPQRALDLSFLHHSLNVHRLSSFTYSNVYVSMLLSQFSPSCPPHYHIHKSVLYVCVSIALLQIDSPVMSFSIPYMCLNISYVPISFWHTLFCIIGSRYIHLIRTDSNVFLFMMQ